MNYRDIILKLLRKRSSISIIEDLALADFSNSDDPKAAFERWCLSNHIIIARTPGDRSITLNKAEEKKT